MAKSKDNGAKSAAKASGSPDWKEPKKTVTGEGNKAKASGTNDFEPGKGEKTVKSGGGCATDDTDAYSTEAKAQKGPSSDF